MDSAFLGKTWRKFYWCTK